MRNIKKFMECLCVGILANKVITLFLANMSSDFSLVLGSHQPQTPADDIGAFFIFLGLRQRNIEIIGFGIGMAASSVAEFLIELVPVPQVVLVPSLSEQG